MPRLVIETPPNADDPRAPSEAWGTRILVDGKELPDVRSIRLDIGMDAPVTATAELLLTEKFTYEAGADVHVHIEVPQGCVLLAQPQADGSTRYSCQADVQPTVRLASQNPDYVGTGFVKDEEWKSR